MRGICFVSCASRFKPPCRARASTPPPVADRSPHQLIKEATASGSKIIYMDGTKDDPNKRKPDISLAKRELGWQPTVTVKDVSQPFFVRYERACIYSMVWYSRSLCCVYFPTKAGFVSCNRWQTNEGRVRLWLWLCCCRWYGEEPVNAPPKRSQYHTVVPRGDGRLLVMPPTKAAAGMALVCNLVFFFFSSLCVFLVFVAAIAVCVVRMPPLILARASYCAYATIHACSASCSYLCLCLTATVVGTVAVYQPRTWHSLAGTFHEI